MTRMEHKTHRVNGLNRLLKWSLFCGLLCLALARAAHATIPLWSNTSINAYIVPGAPPPTIDAASFFNNNQFQIDFTAATINTELFETENTVNYTNNGLMISDGGFLFDTQTTNVISRQMADTFYNNNEIDCGTVNDTNVFYEDGGGQCIIWATNIVNPGIITVGGDGLLQFTGDNVNLSFSELTIQGNSQTNYFNNLNPNFFFFGRNFRRFQNSYGIAGLSGIDYGIGTDTNLDWIPSIALTTNSATSSEFTTSLYPLTTLVLTNSTAYFDIKTPDPNDVIVRAVFLLNSNSQVSNNVYIDPNVNTRQFGRGFGNGASHIEWVAPYIDSSSGLPATNYLYLTDDYVGGNTAVAVDGIPDNFTFVASSSPVALGAPTTPGFPTNFMMMTNFMFNPGAVTNQYSYADVQLTGTTVATNSPSPSVTNYLAILPGRIEINATNELNLKSADLNGANYISIYAPTQFDGSDSAQIYAPYYDINVGVTNGFLTISNLLQVGSQRFNGTIQLWSTTWLYTDTNGVTWDYRVLFVNSQLSPFTPSTVNNLILHATNSTIIADTINIIGTFSDDSQNLTLTANAPGAASPDGELDVATPSILWSNSTPNLRNLTNNGAIKLQNSATFGATPPSEYYSLINNGIISDLGSSVWADTFANSGAFSSGLNSFTLQSLTATLTNGSVTAGGDVSFTATSLFASNTVITAGQSLVIVATNLTDGVVNGGATSSNFWSVGGNLRVGLVMPSKPSGDLLGTTIKNIALDNHIVTSTWPGEDRGASVAGYSNDVAVGVFVLDSLPTTHPASRSGFIFTGAGVSNAIYVDELVLADAATNLDINHNVTALGGNGGGASDNDNVVIYYARALVGGNDLSEKLDYRNNGRLRWVPGYAGYFSSTNIIYTNITGSVTNISTNTVNAALAQANNIDSDGDNINNASDPTPFFVPGEVNFKLTVTNKPPLTALISWSSIPASTNYVLYKTNLLSANWQVLTNFVSPTAVPPVGGWPITNSVSDAVNPLQPRYYRVRVDPNTTYLYGGY